MIDMLARRLGILYNNLSSPSRPMSQVAACIIADEVLNGKTLDTNSNYLAKKCFAYGLDLAHIRVIPDNVRIISETIKHLSSSYEMVFTSGGIGPTHDDLTYESIAKAFNRDLVHHQPTIQLMRKPGSCTELNEGQLRMALLPSPDNVYFTPGLWVPLVQVKNVLVLPGVPRLFHQMIDHWFEVQLLSSGLETLPKIRRMVKTLVRESVLATRLGEIQAEAEKYNIRVGSYPKMPLDDPPHVVLSLVGPVSMQKEIDGFVKVLLGEFDGSEVNV